MRLPTVLIESKNGPLVINESDFDGKVHVLWSDKPKPEPVTKLKPVKKKPKKAK